MPHRQKFGEQNHSAVCTVENTVLKKPQELVTHFCPKLVEISISVCQEWPA